VNRFIDHLRVVTTNNYNTIADFHTTNHSTLSFLSLLSLIFTLQQLSVVAIPQRCFHWTFPGNESYQWRFFRFRCPLVNTPQLNPQLHSTHTLSSLLQVPTPELDSDLSLVKVKVKVRVTLRLWRFTANQFVLASPP
jgi:hypothetical protein